MRKNPAKLINLLAKISFINTIIEEERIVTNKALPKTCMINRFNEMAIKIFKINKRSLNVIQEITIDTTNTTEGE